MTVISQGNYAGRGTVLELIKSPEKGTPGCRVVMQILDGPDKGQTIEWIGWLSDRTSEKTTAALALMGYDGSDERSVSKRDVVLAIEHEEYTRANGESASRARVAWINDPSGGGRLVPMSSTEIAGTKDRLRSAMLALRGVKGPVQAPPMAVDDVEF